MIALDVDGLNSPEEALRFAGEMMVRGEKVTNAYVEAVIEVYHDLGPYFVVAPGIAMPHARPSEAVYASGICMVRLKKPIRFSHPENDPVRLIFMLAGTENNRHLELLGELGELLSDEGKLRKLYEANTYDEVQSLISGTI